MIIKYFTFYVKNSERLQLQPKVNKMAKEVKTSIEAKSDKVNSLYNRNKSVSIVQLLCLAVVANHVVN